VVDLFRRRFVGGWSQRFSTFAPLMSRAVVLNMRRHASNDPLLQRLEETDPVFPKAREEIQKWAASCSLSLDPPMPPSLQNRAADNWRVLLT
jgi:hypothetical protein